MFKYFHLSPVTSLLFLSLGKPSSAQWLEDHIKNEGQKFIITRLEGGGLLFQPTLREVEGPFSVRATMQWMDLLLAALDCYNTFTGLRLLQPGKILGSLNKNTVTVLDIMTYIYFCRDLFRVHLNTCFHSKHDVHSLFFDASEL